jgi:hypothetical protein
VNGPGDIAPVPPHPRRVQVPMVEFRLSIGFTRRLYQPVFALAGNSRMTSRFAAIILDLITVVGTEFFPQPSGGLIFRFSCVRKGGVSQTRTGL